MLLGCWHSLVHLFVSASILPWDQGLSWSYNPQLSLEVAVSDVWDKYQGDAQRSLLLVPASHPTL